MYHPRFFLALPLAIVLSFSYLTIARAQITPDNSLGAESSVVTPNVQIKNVPSDRIHGGAIRGANLFHSFQEFNVNAGRGAYFSNPQGIANILTRVTGGNVSNIQGVLGVLGKANLFLINPNGIIFGPNARLDVGGSFLGSTANSLIFKDGFSFSATNPQAPPLLTITAPVGLSYRENFKNITTQSTTDQYPILQVPEGKTLALVGGNVSLDSPDLLAPGGRVELGGLSAPGTVGLNSDGSLSFPVGVQRADVSLTNQARVGVSAGGGGSIAVNARNLDISGGSGLYAGIRQGSGTVGSQAGDITLNATGDIKVAGSNVFNDVLAKGNGGNINITTGSLSLTEGAELSASTYGIGNGGSVKIDAPGSVIVDKSSVIRSNVWTFGVGNSGGISIDTGSLTVANSSELNSSTVFGMGRAGDITIKARDLVLFDGGFAFSRLEKGAMGRAGDIHITTDGSVLVTGIPSNVANNRIGQLVSATFGEGDAGNIIIRAGKNVSFDGRGSDLYTLVAFDKGVGNAGNIIIDSKSLSVVNGARLISSTESRGNAGNINITAHDTIKVDGNSYGTFSQIATGVNPGAMGNGGKINLNTKSLSITNGAFVNAGSGGNGAAGNIEVAARSIRLENGSTISADTVGGQGNINLGARDYVLLRRGSKITTNATGKATGGNITINAGNLVAFPSENSDITANAQQSSGGQININVKGGIFGIESRPQPTPLSDITASSALGPQFSGTVQINTPEIDPTRGLFELTETVIDPAQQIAQNPCIKGFGNSFTITGRGGLPTDPQKVLSSDNVRVDLIQPVASTVSSTTATKKQPSQKPPVKQIIPAQGWIYNEKGQVVLVAYDPTKTGPQRQQPAPNSSCAAVK